MEIIAKCGNRCDLCPAYRGNIGKFGAQAVSDGWHKYLGFYLAPEKIACVGCINEGDRPSGDCAVRSCCADKSVENCGHCENAICPRLRENITAIENLEQASGDITKEAYETYFKPYHNESILKAIIDGRISPTSNDKTVENKC
ncbi:MAG: DUF3795 domain-containing protein [Clostridia bacterium]|nr:DUF3795 domain-containing protein [Clostridia bacterium]